MGYSSKIIYTLVHTISYSLVKIVNIRIKIGDKQMDKFNEHEEIMNNTGIILVMGPSGMGIELAGDIRVMEAMLPIVLERHEMAMMLTLRELEANKKLWNSIDKEALAEAINERTIPLYKMEVDDYEQFIEENEQHIIGEIHSKNGRYSLDDETIEEIQQRMDCEE